MTSRMVDQLKVKVREVKGPASLVTVEVLGSAKVSQILIVIENFNLVLSAFQDVPPFFRSMNY